MNPILKKLLKCAVAALIAYAVVEVFMNFYMEPKIQRENLERFFDTVEQSIQKEREKLPIDFGGITYDDIQLKGTTIHYYYTVSKESLQQIDLPILELQTKENVCDRKDIDSLFKYGGLISMHVRDENDKKLLDFRINKNDCELHRIATTGKWPTR